MQAYSAVHKIPQPDFSRDPRLIFNPRSDPFVETGYRGYVLRGVAHYRQAQTYASILEIGVYWRGIKTVLCEYRFPEEFVDAGMALEAAIHAGREAIDDQTGYPISMLEVETHSGDAACFPLQASASPRARYGVNFPRKH